MSAVLVLTTLGAGGDARALARLLVEQRLAACVNIVPSLTSVYRWEGEVSEDTEQLLVIKTAEERVGVLREVLFANHPYDVPEFVVVPIAAMSADYEAWLMGSVEPD